MKRVYGGIIVLTIDQITRTLCQSEINQPCFCHDHLLHVWDSGAGVGGLRKFEKESGSKIGDMGRAL